MTIAELDDTITALEDAGSSPGAAAYRSLGHAARSWAYRPRHRTVDPIGRSSTRPLAEHDDRDLPVARRRSIARRRARGGRRRHFEDEGGRPEPRIIPRGLSGDLATDFAGYRVPRRLA